MSIMLIMSCYTGFFNVRRGWQSLNTGPRFYLRLIRRMGWLWIFTYRTTDGCPFKPKKLSVPFLYPGVDQWRNHCQNNLYKPNNCRNWTLKLVLRRFALYTFHCTNYFRRIRVIGALHHFQQYFSYVVVAMQFYIVGENWSSWRKSPTFYYSLTDSLTYCEVVCIEYTSLWEGVQITNHSADGWHWLYHQWW